jgi:hypothetical protein
MTRPSGNDDGGLTPEEFNRNGVVVFALAAALIVFLSALVYFA